MEALEVVRWILFAAFGLVALGFTKVEPVLVKDVEIAPLSEDKTSTVVVEDNSAETLAEMEARLESSLSADLVSFVSAKEKGGKFATSAVASDWEKSLAADASAFVTRTTALTSAEKAAKRLAKANARNNLNRRFG